MIKRKDGFDGERALVLPCSVVREMESHAFLSNLFITDIGYYPKAHHHYRERKTPVDQFILIYCMEGEGWYQYGNHKYRVKPNQCFIIPSGVPHAYGADEEHPWTIYWIHFNGKLADSFLPTVTSPIDLKPGPYSRIGDWIELFEEIFNTLEMGYSYGYLHYACSIFYHYLGALRYIKQNEEASPEDKGKVDLVILSIHYMKENIEKKLSLQEIAEQIGYSASHFSVLFSRRTGYSPLTYFNQLKIQKACQLLDFTDMKINQICYKVGIEDCYYFSRLFHKIMGVSPMAYRQMKKG